MVVITLPPKIHSPYLPLPFLLRRRRACSHSDRGKEEDQRRTAGKTWCLPGRKGLSHPRVQGCVCIPTSLIMSASSSVHRFIIRHFASEITAAWLALGLSPKPSACLWNRHRPKNTCCFGNAQTQDSQIARCHSPCCLGPCFDLGGTASLLRPSTEGRACFCPASLTLVHQRPALSSLACWLHAALQTVAPLAAPLHRLSSDACPQCAHLCPHLSMGHALLHLYTSSSW